MEAEAFTLDSSRYHSDPEYRQSVQQRFVEEPQQVPVTGEDGFHLGDSEGPHNIRRYYSDYDYRKYVQDYVAGHTQVTTFGRYKEIKEQLLSDARRFDHLPVPGATYWYIQDAQGGTVRVPDFTQRIYAQQLNRRIDEHNKAQDEKAPPPMGDVLLGFDVLKFAKGDAHAPEYTFLMQQFNFRREELAAHLVQFKSAYTSATEPAGRTGAVHDEVPFDMDLPENRGVRNTIKRKPVVEHHPPASPLPQDGNSHDSPLAAVNPLLGVDRADARPAFGGADAHRLGLKRPGPDVPRHWRTEEEVRADPYHIDPVDSRTFAQTPSVPESHFVDPLGITIPGVQEAKPCSRFRHPITQWPMHDWPEFTTMLAAHGLTYDDFRILRRGVVYIQEEGIRGRKPFAKSLHQMKAFLQGVTQNLQRRGLHLEVAVGSGNGLPAWQYWYLNVFHVSVGGGRPPRLGDSRQDPGDLAPLFRQVPGLSADNNLLMATLLTVANPVTPGLYRVRGLNAGLDFAKTQLGHMYQTVPDAPRDAINETLAGLRDFDNGGTNLVTQQELVKLLQLAGVPNALRASCLGQPRKTLFEDGPETLVLPEAQGYADEATFKRRPNGWLIYPEEIPFALNTAVPESLKRRGMTQIDMDLIQERLNLFQQEYVKKFTIIFWLTLGLGMLAIPYLLKRKRKAITAYLDSEVNPVFAAHGIYVSVGKDDDPCYPALTVILR
ncbi:hypothetical protein TrVFT333_002718 [Trichoderma virens FT-333]|nr:hypothetical protein TrVFT333_002718 [Trichoderma virens FT-333]